MTKGDLDGVFVLGRPFKPLAMFMSAYMAVIFIYNSAGAGVLEELFLGKIIALVGAVSWFMLVIGWVFRNQRLAELGLLSASAVWMLRALFILFTNGMTQSFWFSVIGSGLAASAFVLEARDPNGVGRHSERE